MKKNLCLVGCGLEVIECGSAVAGQQILGETKVDLLIVDCFLPDLGGIKWVGTMSEAPCLVITSERKEDALEAFETDAIDFLQKPVSPGRILETLKRFFRLARKEARTDRLSSFIPDEAVICVEDQGKTHRIPVGEISYVEEVNNRLLIQIGQVALLVQNSFENLAALLAPWPFLRIHDSRLVSISRIRSFTSTTVELPQATLNIGRKYQKFVSTSLM